MRQNWLDEHFADDERDFSDWEGFAESFDNDFLPPLSADFTDRVLAEVNATAAVADERRTVVEISREARGWNRADLKVWSMVAAALLLAVGVYPWLASQNQTEPLTGSGSGVETASSPIEVPAENLEMPSVEAEPLDAIADVAPAAPPSFSSQYFFPLPGNENATPIFPKDYRELFADISASVNQFESVKPVTSSFGVAFGALMKTLPQNRSEAPQPQANNVETPVAVVS